MQNVLPLAGIMALVLAFLLERGTQASTSTVTASTSGANIAYWSLLRGKSGPVQLITCKKTRTCTTKVRERMRETESMESPLHVYVAR